MADVLHWSRLETPRTPADMLCTTMRPAFREDKLTQAAALFLKLRGGTMSHLKLMKLLYMAERQALLTWRRPIVYDCYVCMDKGPVLSRALNIIHGEEHENDSFWSRHISPCANNEVSLIQDPGTGNLSDAEVSLIERLFDQHGRKSRWELCDLTHEFPEWQDPQGSSIAIDYRDILKGSGMTDIEAQSIIDEIESLAMMDSLMGKQVGD